MARVNSVSHSRFRLGDWQVDTASNSLLRRNVRRQIEPRAMDVLVLLAERAPEVLSSDEILNACWQQTFQGDNAVHKIITQLRHAFDDRAGQPAYIETIRKRGYRLVPAPLFDADAAAGSWLHESPFRGLAPFEEQHAAIFFGRQSAIDRLLDIATAQVAQGCAMLLVLGPSGSGKTSLVRAGLVPALASGTPGGGLSVTCHVYLDCVDLGGIDLLQAVASVLLDVETGGVPVFHEESAASLGRRLATGCDDVLAHLRQCLGAGRLLLFVDRLEALFHLPHLTDALRQQFITLLEHVACAGPVLVVLACRNDLYPQLATFTELIELKERGGHYDLRPPTPTDISQIVRQPARAAQLRFGTDAVTGERLDDTLCNAATGGADALPLLQYCLAELFRQRGASGELSYAVYRELGGIEGALAQRAEQVFTTLTPDQAAAFAPLLSQLVVIAEHDRAAMALRLPWAALRTPAQQGLVKALVDARLFVSDLDGGVASFGVAHDALLRRWPRVLDWIETHRQALQTRTRLREQARRWHTDERRPDLLLPDGIQLEQADGLLRMPQFSFDPNEQAFIAASRQQARRARRLWLAAFASLAALAIAASVLGLLAHSAEQAAQAHRAEAEGLMTYMLGELAEKLRPLGRLELLDSISARAMAYLGKDASGNGATALHRARALQVLAEVRIARADPLQARQALLLARAILHRQLLAAPRDTGVLKGAGENAYWLGHIHFEQQDFASAEHYFIEYRDLARRMSALAPDDVAGWIELSYAHSCLGTLALQRGQVAQAGDAFGASVRLKERALARRPGDLDLAADLADSLSWQAAARTRQGHLAETAALHARELAVMTRLHAGAPGDTRWSNDLASALAHQGTLDRITGDAVSAAARFAQAVTLLEELVRHDPTNRVWQHNLHVVRLDLFRLAPGDASPARQLATLATWEAAVTELARLEPRKADLQLLLAKLKQQQSYIYFNDSDPEAAARRIMPVVRQLEQLNRTNGDVDSVRTVLAEALLWQAKLMAVLNDDAGARLRCHQVQALLAPVAAGSADFTVLAPLVRAHACLGDRAKAATLEQTLAAMHYREPDYLRDLSTLHRKEQANE